MLLRQPGGWSRTTPVSQSPRAPYCMMGVCFECLVEIDGQGSVQSCLTPVAAGMRIARQQMAGETLRRDAVRLVVKGRTTIEEAMRISNQFED